MAKKVVRYEETIKYKHEIIIEENVTDEEIDNAIEEIEDNDIESIDDVYGIFKDVLGNKVIDIIRDVSGEIDDIEYFDDYIDKEYS